MSGGSPANLDSIYIINRTDSRLAHNTCLSALQAAAERNAIIGYSTSYSHPTLLMHLEIKRLLPPQGPESLFVRAHAHEITNGRFDANVTIMNEKFELVALCHQICLVVEGTTGS